MVQVVRTLEQVATGQTTTGAIMRSRMFRLGVDEYRAGKLPDFERDDWNYERGRQWAAIAPRNMPLWKGGRLNPAALELMDDIS